MEAPLLQVKDLRIYFPLNRGLFSRNRLYVKAVDGVSIDIRKGETLGVVGESGSGKSTLALSIAGLYRPFGGAIRFRGIDLALRSGRDLRLSRRPMQMVFQDPYGSFNPRMTIGAMLQEAMKIHRLGNRSRRREKAGELLRLVGMTEDCMKRYPHEFSGGQRQRLGIARALAVDPEFLILDEPVSALDVSMQAQILNLLKELQSRLNLTFLFIAHDVGVIKHMSDRVAVMYLGRIVEIMKDEDLDENARHPYTISLLSAVPTLDENKPRSRVILKGDIPSPIDIPSGCRFRTRCGKAFDSCRSIDPRLVGVGNEHQVACLMYDEGMP